MNDPLTSYERKAQAEVAVWRAKPPGAVAKALAVLNKPLQKPIELVMDKTPVGKAAEGVLRVAMDGASWSVNEDRILASYRSDGQRVESLDDIRYRVPLDGMDRQAGKLAKAYRSGAGGEGAVLGVAAFYGPAAGAAALAGDLVALTGIACRAAAHHAAVYGYRVDTAAEQALALSVLSGASSADLPAKELALKELRDIAVMAAKKKTWKELEKNALVKALQEGAERLGYGLTKAKLGGVVAGLGVVIGGGYNAWFLHNVCDWAFNIYRERHIMDKLAAHDANAHMQPPVDNGVVDADVVEDDENEGGTEAA